MFIKKIVSKKKISSIKPIERIVNQFKGLPFKLVSVLTLYSVTIRMTQNNIFCYIGDVITNKTFFKLSAGIVKINITKRTLKFHSARIVPYFFSVLHNKTIRNIVSVNYILPKLLKRKFFFIVLSKFKKVLTKKIKKTFFKIFFFHGKKSFNGCRVAKLKRKKYGHKILGV